MSVTQAASIIEKFAAFYQKSKTGKIGTNQNIIRRLLLCMETITFAGNMGLFYRALTYWKSAGGL